MRHLPPSVVALIELLQRDGLTVTHRFTRDGSPRLRVGDGREMNAYAFLRRHRR